MEHGDQALGAKKTRLRLPALQALERLVLYWRQAMQLLASAVQHPRLRWVRKPSPAMPTFTRQGSTPQGRSAHSPSRELLTLPLLASRVRVRLARLHPVEWLMYRLQDLQELALSARSLPQAARQLRSRALQALRHLTRLRLQVRPMWHSLWTQPRAVWDRLRFQPRRTLRSPGLPEQERSRVSSSGDSSILIKTQNGAEFQHHNPRLGRASAQAKTRIGKR